MALSSKYLVYRSSLAAYLSCVPGRYGFTSIIGHFISVALVWRRVSYVRHLYGAIVE